jgi:uncharacterized delta-60 repeat protein
MKRSALLLLCVALVAATCLGQFADDGFDPDADGTVYAIAVQTDGKIILGGLFETIGGVARTFVGRVFSDGKLDTSFAPGVIVPGSVQAIACQPDGKIIIGGGFSEVAGQARYNIARLNADGSLDMSFNPGANSTVKTLTIQGDGKILVGGNFLNLGGQVKNFIGRLNADGSPDTAFNPTADGPVLAVALQPDGKIVVGGAFTLIGGQNRLCITRLNTDGSGDSTFAQTNGANDVVICLAIQADGKIIIGGYFETAAGAAHPSLARLNADGSLDNAFNPVGQDQAIRTLALQPDGKIVVGGHFTILSGGGRIRIGRLNTDGTLDSSFECPGGALDTVYTLALQADGKILAGGPFHTIGGVDRNNIGRLYPDGRTDADFLDADLDPASGADNTVYALAQQPDWRLLAGGLFQNISGSARMRMARLQIDGVLDAINPLADTSVRAIAVQADGKILLGGLFTHLGGAEYKYIARLDTANNLEVAFHPDPDGTVRCILPQTNGQIVIAGDFTKIGAADCVRIGRINADGTLDNTFNVPGGADDIVYSALLQPDGKIVVAGEFTHLAGAARNRIGRLNSDGSLDASFDPNLNNNVYAIALQPDGKILVGGIFTAVGADATERNRIARLNIDGSLDTSFAVPGGANLSVRSIGVQADGKILVGGGFTTIGGLGIKHLAQLNADGSIDADYVPDPNMPDNTVQSLLLQPDGKHLIGGEFTSLDAYTRRRLARITPTRPAIQRLDINATGTLVSWIRTGSCPELDRVTFEQSSDGATWTAPGAGTRMTNGWQATASGLSPNVNIYIRARGFYRCGYFNCSMSVCESIQLMYLTPPAVAITNLAAVSTAAVDAVACTLAGTANSNVIGSMQWTNCLTGENGAFPAAASWSVADITLLEGANVLTVSASNTLGQIASASVSLAVPWSKPLAADYDGDGYADPAAYYGNELYVWPSLFNYPKMGPLPYGVAGGLPAAADFDGDRLADPAAYAGVDWYAWLSRSGYAQVGPYSYGIAGALPVATDFDGDAIGDVAVYAGTDWTAWLSGSGYAEGGPYSYGIAGAIPTAADFDGDGLADPAVYSGTEWTAWLSGSGYAQVGPYSYGFAGAIPIAADFDGDGIGDVAVSHNRQWYAWTSGMGYAQIGPYAFNLQ